MLTQENQIDDLETEARDPNEETLALIARRKELIKEIEELNAIADRQVFMSEIDEMKKLMR